MVPARESKDRIIVKAWICSIIPRANFQEFGEQGRGNFYCCRRCVSCSVEKLNLFTSTEFTRGNRIFDILNIKYILFKKKNPNPFIMILFLWIKVLMQWQMGLFLSHWNFPSVSGKVTLEVDTFQGPRLWCHGTNELSTNLSVECKLQVLARHGHPTVAVFSICFRREESNRQFASVCM